MRILDLGKKRERENMLVFNLNIKKKKTKRRDGWMEREIDLPRCWVFCVWKVCLVIIIIIVKGRGICDVFHVVFFRVERRYGTYGQAVGVSANEVQDRICTKVLCILHNH